jgi:hypothetical protein
MAAENKATALLDDEVLLIRHSGEIPEVAMHGSIYYLTQDPQGPGISLTDDELTMLKEAVIERYREIIMRDLNPANRDEPLYRGLARCIANWQRLQLFCSREGFDPRQIRTETAAALQLFIRHELRDVATGIRSSCVNCTYAEMQLLFEGLGLHPADLPDACSSLWAKE